MGPLTLAALVAGGAFVASMTFDVGLNAMQNWYDVIYADAFWSTRVGDTPVLRALTREEAEIDRLLQSEDYARQPPRR
jgi:hypothetical protein